MKLKRLIEELGKVKDVTDETEVVFQSESGLTWDIRTNALLELVSQMDDKNIVYKIGIK